MSLIKTENIEKNRYELHIAVDSANMAIFSGTSHHVNSTGTLSI